MKISKNRQTDRHTRKWILRAPFQGFRTFSFNLTSRIGPKNACNYYFRYLVFVNQVLFQLVHVEDSLKICLVDENHRGINRFMTLLVDRLLSVTYSGAYQQPISSPLLTMKNWKLVNNISWVRTRYLPVNLYHNITIYGTIGLEPLATGYGLYI